eukprot:1162150-Pelagomonas_calceolata.AAC.6
MRRQACNAVNARAIATAWHNHPNLQALAKSPSILNGHTEDELTLHHQWPFGQRLLFLERRKGTILKLDDNKNETLMKLKMWRNGLLDFVKDS